jgi:hypothetical protein
MAADGKRLVRLADTLDRLRDVLSGRIATLQQERIDQLQRRAMLEELMACDTRFLDLTMGGGLKRLRDISARLSVIDQEITALRQRSADAFLKAKRARATAKLRQAVAAQGNARLALAELVDARTFRKLAASE